MTLRHPLNCASCEVVNELIMTASRFRLRLIQVVCLSGQVVLVLTAAFFSAAILASNKGPGAGMALGFWVMSCSALAILLLAYWACGVLRDRAAMSLKHTLPATEIKTSHSRIR